MYRPYILTDEQKDTLDDQISDTEEDILEKIEKWQDEHPEQMLLGWHRLPSTRQMRRRRDNYSSRSKSRSGSSRSRTRLGSERGDKMDVDGEKTFKPERRESMAESRNGDVTMGLDGAESRKNSLGSPPPPVPKPKAEVEEAPAVKGPETAPEQEQAPALMEPELEQETNKVDVEMKVVEEHEDDDEIETSEGVSLIY